MKGSNGRVYNGNTKYEDIVGKSNQRPQNADQQQQQPVIIWPGSTISKKTQDTEFNANNPAPGLKHKSKKKDNNKMRKVKSQ